jgi:hypothetical protein
MKCPVCGTNGIEKGVCFYCAAKEKRKKKPPDEPRPPRPDGK